jgi:Na+/H+ antiporter NhaD/arsenite permease-like protein
LLLTLLLFVVGYTFITLEHSIGINKAAIALLTGVLCWTAYLFHCSDATVVSEQLMAHLGETSGILFFLVGAMTVVQLIDAHDGFHIISNAIQTTDKRKLLWIVSFLTFFLSAILDNLTTTIVMISLLRTLISDKEDRWLFAGMVIIAANAGGAWSPIGDVTTTMLWIGGQITAMHIVLKLILPALACLLLPLLLISLKMKGNIQRSSAVTNESMSTISRFHRNLVFFCGMGVLVLIPVFKSITHLPPFMGMLLGLGCLWVLSEIIHKDRDTPDKDMLSVVYALRKIDVPSILFFLGILLAVSALQTAGHLTLFASFLEDHIRNQHMIATIIGLCSAIVDNVPLVAACTGMYDLNHFPTDHPFWEFIAYCTGTGGSVLIIGSAAGVAAMGMENIPFFWYLKKISWLALLGYFGGALVYIVCSA